MAGVTGVSETATLADPHSYPRIAVLTVTKTVMPFFFVFFLKRTACENHDRKLTMAERRWPRETMQGRRDLERRPRLPGRGMHFATSWGSCYLLLRALVKKLVQARFE